MFHFCRLASPIDVMVWSNHQADSLDRYRRKEPICYTFGSYKTDLDAFSKLRNGTKRFDDLKVSLSSVQVSFRNMINFFVYLAVDRSEHLYLIQVNGRVLSVLQHLLIRISNASNVCPDTNPITRRTINLFLRGKIYLALHSWRGMMLKSSSSVLVKFWFLIHQPLH